MRWPKGPPHLAPSPRYFVFFFCFFFRVFALNRKMFSPLTRAFLHIFECRPLFLLTLFWPPPFSLPLSLSLSCFFFSSFLLVFLCSLSFGSFLSLSFPSSLLSCHEKNNMKLLNFKVFYSVFFWGGFLSCFSFKSLFLVFAFSDFSLCFLFNINVFAFKKDK